METKSPQEVAALLGVDEVTIRRLRRKAGLPERQRGQGYTLDEIALLRAQQRYKVHAPDVAPTGAEANLFPDEHADIARESTELSASAPPLIAKYEQLLSPSWETSRSFEAAPGVLSEQLANIARQNDRIMVQNDRIEQSLRALHARLEELTDGGVGLIIESSPRERSARSGQKQVRGPRSGQVPPSLPPGTVTLAAFAAQTNANLGTLKSRLKPYVNPEIRLETTQLDTGAGDGRKAHYLTPEQQRKALLQWHLHGFAHTEHPLCPEPHKQVGDT
jgi:hypothetical protein